MACQQQFEPGDLLFFWGTDATSRVIRRYTRGPSHVGGLVDFRWIGKDKRTERLLVESTTLIHGRKCVIRGVEFAGVQAQYPTQRIEDYCEKGGHVELWRFTKDWGLSETEQQLLSRLAWRTLGRPYDTRQAIGSGTRVVKHVLSKFGIGKANYWKYFCSELWADLFMKLGRMNIGNPSDWSPAELMEWLDETRVMEPVRKWV